MVSPLPGVTLGGEQSPTVRCAGLKRVKKTPNFEKHFSVLDHYNTRTSPLMRIYSRFVVTSAKQSSIMEKVTIRTTKSVTGHCKEVNDTVVVMTIIKRRYVGMNENTEHKLSF